ncbi:MAG: hypothetical protein HZB43_12045 [candidate division Zixibacteria bacterium]|nr:hypothetical protein [candidate division Zixibacteria bacterium]
MMAKLCGGTHISTVSPTATPIKSKPRVFAVCDVGTFTGLILVVRSSGARLTPVVEERYTIDLLSGKGPSGHLTGVALERAGKVARRFVQVAEEQGADKGAIVCTAAVRDAPNGSQFAGSLQKLTEYPVRVLSARREAALSVLGAISGLKVSASPTITVDIGGGSTEVVFTDKGRMRFRLINCGAVRATAEWGRAIGRSTVRSNQYHRLSELVFDDLSGLRGRVPRVIGVGGTLVTLAAIHCRLKSFDSRRLHGTTLTLDWIAEMADRLAAMDQRAIRRLIPFDPHRARVLTAGTFLWAGVLNRLHANRVIVSVRGLRWGVAVRLSEQGRP